VEQQCPRVPSVVPSSLDDGDDLLNFFPDRCSQLGAGLVDLGPVLLPDLHDLGLLLIRQV
jgi:hypothetical protein